jgi:hypothetical protein
VLFAGEGLSADGSLLKWQPWSDTALAADLPRGNPLLRDQYAFFNANEEYISRWVRRGVWPLWNPDLAHGIPTVASIQNAEYYPTNLIFWLVPPFWSRGVRAILRVALCLFGTYAFVRAIGMGRPGATLAAMSFGFCGFNVVWLAHPPSNVSFVLPCILWTLERSLQTGAFKWGVGLTLSASAALLGGHFPTVFHITIIILIWLAYRHFIRPADPAPRLRRPGAPPPVEAVSMAVCSCGHRCGADRQHGRPALDGIRRTESDRGTAHQKPPHALVGDARRVGCSRFLREPHARRLGLGREGLQAPGLE